MDGANGPDGPRVAVIRTASWRDLRSITELESLCFGKDSWPWLELLAALTWPGTVRVMAELDGRAVGYAIGDRRSGNELGWVASLGVHPEYRRRGIGRQLLEACEQALGTRRVRLTLRTTNAAALALYRGAGYEQVDVWNRYYRDGEDGIVMERVP
jgi:ribosomal-protein-alanine N-acetyltransferase